MNHSAGQTEGRGGLGFIRSPGSGEGSSVVGTSCAGGRCPTGGDRRRGSTSPSRTSASRQGRAGLRRRHGKRQTCLELPPVREQEGPGRRCLQPSQQEREPESSRKAPRGLSPPRKEETGSTHHRHPQYIRPPPGPLSPFRPPSMQPDGHQLGSRWAADGSGTRAQLSQENPQSQGLLLRAEWTPGFGGWAVSIYYSRGPPGGLVGLSCLC